MKRYMPVFLLVFLGAGSPLYAETLTTPEACSQIAALSNSNKLVELFLPTREPTQDERVELAKRGDDFRIIEVSSHLGRESFRYYQQFSRYGRCRNPTLHSFDKPTQPKLDAAELVSKHEQGPCDWQAIAEIGGVTHLLLYGSDNHLQTSINLDSSAPESCQYIPSFEPDPNAVCPIDNGSRQTKAALDERWLSADNPFAVYFDNADFYESISSARLMEGPIAQILTRRVFSGKNGGSIHEDYRLISHDGKVDEAFTRQLNELTRERLILQDVYSQSDGTLLFFDNRPFMTRSVRVKLFHGGRLESCETSMLRTLTVTRNGIVNW